MEKLYGQNWATLTSVTNSLIADYERPVFSAVYFYDFLSARIVESRPMTPSHKRPLNYDSLGLTSTWA